LQTDRHLRRAAAQRHEGQTDEQRSNTKRRGEADCGANRQLGADDQQQQAADPLDQAR